MSWLGLTSSARASRTTIATVGFRRPLSISDRYATLIPARSAATGCVKPWRWRSSRTHRPSARESRSARDAAEKIASVVTLPTHSEDAVLARTLARSP